MLLFPIEEAPFATVTTAIGQLYVGGVPSSDVWLVERDVTSVATSLAALLGSLALSGSTFIYTQSYFVDPLELAEIVTFELAVLRTRSFWLEPPVGVASTYAVPVETATVMFGELCAFTANDPVAGETPDVLVYGPTMPSARKSVAKKFASSEVVA